MDVSQMKGKKVYIASPLKAPTRKLMDSNARAAKRYMEVVSYIFQCRAYALHSVLHQFFDDAVYEERELALYFGRCYMDICEALIVCGDRISDGMYSEIKAAQLIDLPVFRLETTNFKALYKMMRQGKPSFEILTSGKVRLRLMTDEEIVALDDAA